MAAVAEIGSESRAVGRADGRCQGIGRRRSLVLAKRGEPLGFKRNDFICFYMVRYAVRCCQRTTAIGLQAKGSAM